MTQAAELPRIAIWGAGGHAAVVADIVRLEGTFEIAGFLDDVESDRRDQAFCGATILGGREMLAALLRDGVRHVLLAIGDCAVRRKLSAVVRDIGFQTPIAVHPRAVVAPSAVLGPGTVVAAGAVVNPGVTIGNSVIINTSATVDHGCEIGASSHICPGAHLAGGVVVGEETQVGIGASVIERVTIGSRVTIGAGAVVVRDIRDGAVAMGIPARIVRIRNE